MNFKAWRYVESGNDNEAVYQCLNCREKWVGCTNPHYWTYCPYCGCKWLGEHKCRPHTIPRWAWDLWSEGREPYKPYDSAFWAERDRKENAKRIWVIERRTRFKGKGWLEWKFDQHIFGSWGEAEAGKRTMSGWRDAKRSLDYLRTERESDEWVEYQYRAVVAMKGSVR